MPFTGRKTAQLYSTEIARAVNRVSFELLKNGIQQRFLTLIVNPDDYTVSWSSKNTAQETVSDNYVEEWGRGLGTLTMSGITGYRARSIPGLAKAYDGYTMFRDLKDLFVDYLQTAADNRRADLPVVKISLRVHLWEDDEHYEITLDGPEAFQKIRNNQRPLIYGYKLSAKILGDIKKTDLRASDRADVIAYQRAQNALVALSESSADLDKWIAINNVATPLGFAYQQIQGFAASAAGFMANVSSWLNTYQQARAAVTSTIDLGTDAAEIIREGMGILGATLLEAPMEDAIEITRPIRRIVCASQNIKGLDFTQSKVYGKAADVAEAYRTAGDTASC